ncbi:hypothetical protein ILYODFUR_032524 [Ilyodon furcidens]|uniref:Uncharacterized protein n=1 Tax=Ilyodon furcidens TaxID=33524 RepID=A0ABV0SUJ9_9TELE
MFNNINITRVLEAVCCTCMFPCEHGPLTVKVSCLNLHIRSSWCMFTLNTVFVTESTVPQAKRWHLNSCPGKTFNQPTHTNMKTNSMLVQKLCTSKSQSLDDCPVHSG